MHNYVMLYNYTAVQSQNAVYAYFTSKQILPSGFVEQYMPRCVWKSQYHNSSLPRQEHAFSVQHQIRCHNVFRLSYLGFQWKKLIAKKSSLMRGNEIYNSIRFSANKSNYPGCFTGNIIVSRLNFPDFHSVFNFPGICLLDFTWLEF